MEPNTLLTGTTAFIFLLMALFVIAWLINESGRKQLERDYERDYKKLVMLVENSVVCASGKAYIIKEFEAIERYKCRNKEKIEVLKYAFYKRFASVK